jgi:hypothetical protein
VSLMCGMPELVDTCEGEKERLPMCILAGLHLKNQLASFEIDVNCLQYPVHAHSRTALITY